MQLNSDWYKKLLLPPTFEPVKLAMDYLVLKQPVLVHDNLSNKGSFWRFSLFIIFYFKLDLTIVLTCMYMDFLIKTSMSHTVFFWFYHNIRTIFFHCLLNKQLY